MDKVGRKTRRKRRKHTNAKHYALHAKAIIYCCVLFDLTGKIHEAVQQQDLKTLTFICIENVVKFSFICHFIVTAKNLIWPVVFYFSVHGDWKWNNIYLQHWWVTESLQIKERQPLTDKLLESIKSSKSKNNRKFALRKDLQPTNLGWIPWILLKLSFITLRDLKLSCLHTFTTPPFPWCKIRKVSYKLRRHS